MSSTFPILSNSANIGKNLKVFKDISGRADKVDEWTRYLLTYLLVNHVTLSHFEVDELTSRRVDKLLVNLSTC